MSIKYASEDSIDNRKKTIENEYNAPCMLELSIEHISGKGAIELVKKKQ